MLSCLLKFSFGECQRWSKSHLCCRGKEKAEILSENPIWNLEKVAGAGGGGGVAELRNVISFTQSKSFKPNFTPWKVCRSRQNCEVSYTFYPNVPIFLHRYICHICEISQLWGGGGVLLATDICFKIQFWCRSSRCQWGWKGLNGQLHILQNVGKLWLFFSKWKNNLWINFVKVEVFVWVEKIKTGVFSPRTCFFALLVVSQDALFSCVC